VDTLGGEIFERFLDEVVEWIRVREPREFERAGAAQVRALASQVVDRCRGSGTIRVVHVFEFARAQLVLGAGFDREPWRSS